MDEQEEITSSNHVFLLKFQRLVPPSPFGDGKDWIELEANVLLTATEMRKMRDEIDRLLSTIKTEES